MMTRISILTVAALIGFVGIAQAQPAPRLDPNGLPYVGQSDWHPGPGDYTRQRPGPQAPTGYAPREQATAPMDRPQHSESFKDEYGFRYDARGDRIDQGGRRMSPQNPNPNR